VQNNRIFEYIDVKDYFSIDYQQRKILQQFNFDIFQSLEKDIFTKDERQKLEKLQQQFIKNISKYDSQTLINKEYERIMIEFSRKSSAIE
jgi:uncharacterized FlgJ-related protein